MTSIIGHHAEIASFLDAMRGGRPHHAWLLTGAQGLGKARFAHAAATRILAEGAGPMPPGEGLSVADDHPTAHLIAAYSHPDFLLLDRLPADRKLREKPRTEWPDPVDLARNVNVEQVRQLNKRFVTRPTFSDWRFVIVDAIDDLERSAANALLKTLEEPPQGTIFLLVSHAPGRLLPTVRSRCRVLRFATLADADVAAIVRQEMPGADAAEIRALVRAGAGSPGRALGFAGLDIAALDTAMATLAATGDPANATRTVLARSLALKAAQPRYETFLSRAPGFIAAEARNRRGQALADAIALWEEARSLAGSAVGLSLDPQSVVFELGTIIAGLAPKGAVAKGR